MQYTNIKMFLIKQYQKGMELIIDIFNLGKMNQIFNYNNMCINMAYFNN